MTIAQVLSKVDELKPNQYDDTIKIGWLSALEGQIVNDVVMTHEPPRPRPEDNRLIIKNTTDSEDSDSDDTDTTDTDETTEAVDEDTPIEDLPDALIHPENFSGYTEDDYDTTMVAPDTYANMYIFYCMAMIDFFNSETDRYQNSMLMYNAAYQSFVGYYNKTHKPKQIPLKVF